MNLKESMQNVSKTPVRLCISNGRPSFLQRRAGKINDLKLTSKTPSTNDKDIGLHKIGDGPMANLNLSYKKKQHSDVNLQKLAISTEKRSEFSTTQETNATSDMNSLQMQQAHSQCTAPSDFALI